MKIFSRGLFFSRIVAIFIFLGALSFPLFAESVFLKDGSIIEGKITKETDKQITLKLPDKTTMLIERIKILRTLFDESYKKKVFIKKTSGKTAEGFIVDEDSTWYTIRDSLESPAEYKIDRKDVVALSSEKLISKGTYYALGIIPGASQFYAGKDLKGTIFLGSSLAAWGFTGYSYYYYSKAKKDYNAIPRGSSQSTFDSKYKKYQTGSTMILAGLGVSGAIYLAHWVDTIWFSAPDFSTTTNEPKAGASFDLYFGPAGASAYQCNTDTQRMQFGPNPSDCFGSSEFMRSPSTSLRTGSAEALTGHRLPIAESRGEIALSVQARMRF